jgi:TolB-like protein/DNA-binding winged helix-turn-helix (wHTH) protein
VGPATLIGGASVTQSSDQTSSVQSNSDLMTGFQIGEFAVRPREEHIDGPAGSIHLEPKVMQVLVALARRSGETVTRDQLLEEVWSGSVVGDEVLSRAISLLRSALGDERVNPHFIRTVPRRGYELIVPVEPLTDKSERQSRWPIYTIAVCTVIAVVSAGVFMSSKNPESTTVAVIPFSVSTAMGEDSLIGDGITDYLISALTRSKDLSIIARHSSFALRDSTMNVRDIGNMLGAELLVEGALSRTPSQILLTLSLVESATGTSLWTEQLTGSASDIADLQDDALSALSNALGQQLNIPPLKPIEREHSPDSQAYRSYLEARYQWSLRGNPRITRAIELLEQAIEQEPDFARAHLALAQSQAVAPFYSDALVPDGFAQARIQARTAVALEPALSAEVDALEGFMLMTEMRWDEAFEKLDQSLKNNPRNALAHFWQSMLLSKFGRFAAALKHIQNSADLDPMSAVINDRLALAYLWMNQNDKAGAQYQRALSLGFLESTQPKPQILFALRQGRYEDIERALIGLGSSPEWVHAFGAGLREPNSRPAGSLIIDAAIAAGEIPRTYWFGIWVLFGDADRAFRDFDTGYKSQDIEFLWAEESDFLRRDPRFDGLLERVSMPPPALSDEPGRPRSVSE